MTIKWWIWTHPPSIEIRTLADERAFCQQKAQQVETRTDIPVLAFDQKTNRLIGTGGLAHCDWKNREFTIGFSVRTNETSKGYASEIAHALTHHAFEQFQATKVIAFHEQGNIGSQKVLEKIGFKPTKIVNAQQRMGDKPLDEHHYSISNLENLTHYTP